MNEEINSTLVYTKLSSFFSKSVNAVFPMLYYPITQMLVSRDMHMCVIKPSSPVQRIGFPLR
jgi:hypothetical protein